MSYCNECPNHDACDTGCIIGAARLSRTPRDGQPRIVLVWNGLLVDLATHTIDPQMFEGEDPIHLAVTPMLRGRAAVNWMEAHSSEKKELFKDAMHGAVLNPDGSITPARPVSAIEGSVGPWKECVYKTKDAPSTRAPAYYLDKTDWYVYRSVEEAKDRGCIESELIPLFTEAK